MFGRVYATAYCFRAKIKLNNVNQRITRNISFYYYLNHRRHFHQIDDFYQSQYYYHVLLSMIILIEVFLFFTFTYMIHNNNSCEKTTRSSVKCLKHFGNSIGTLVKIKNIRLLLYEREFFDLYIRE